MGFSLDELFHIEIFGILKVVGRVLHKLFCLHSSIAIRSASR